MNRRKSLGALLIASGVLLVVASTFLLVILPIMLKPTTNLLLGDGVFKAQVALNDNERTVGLSGVTKLDPDQALIMAFPSEAKWQINIKAMKMPIDIVWLSVDKKIIYIVKGASPDSSSSDIFEPKLPAKYVIELPAGTVDSKVIKIDHMAIFQIDEGDIK